MLSARGALVLALLLSYCVYVSHVGTYGKNIEIEIESRQLAEVFSTLSCLVPLDCSQFYVYCAIRYSYM